MKVMGCREDVGRKRQLFESWLSQHQQHAAALSEAGRLLDVQEAVRRVSSLVGPQPAGEFVYVLLEQRDEQVPAYVGKSRTPVRRWTSHLRSLLVGKGSYARWQARLLNAGLVRYPLTLYVIGQGQVHTPPIPGFPVAIGAVEYQLLGLAEDAYALPLLNVEGQRR